MGDRELLGRDGGMRQLRMDDACFYASNIVPVCLVRCGDTAPACPPPPGPSVPPPLRRLSQFPMPHP